MKFNLLCNQILQKVWVRHDGIALLEDSKAIPPLKKYHLTVKDNSFSYHEDSAELIKGHFVIQNDEIILLIDGHNYRFVLMPEAASRQEEVDTELVAELPGKIIKIHVKVGDLVTKGSPLLVLEAMKMEHTLVAKGQGQINEIFVKEGEQVQAGQILLSLKPT